jgi:hypothetical protein
MPESSTETGEAIKLSGRRGGFCGFVPQQQPYVSLLSAKFAQLPLLRPAMSALDQTGH